MSRPSACASTKASKASSSLSSLLSLLKKMKRMGMNWAALPRPSEGTRSTAWRRDSAMKTGSEAARLSRSSRGHEALTRLAGCLRSAFRILQMEPPHVGCYRAVRTSALHVHRQPPLGWPSDSPGTASGRTRSGGVSASSRSVCGGAEGFVLGLHPFGVGVAAGRFVPWPGASTWSGISGTLRREKR